MSTRPNLKIAKTIARVLGAVGDILIGIALALALLAVVDIITSIDLRHTTTQEFVQILLSAGSLQRLVVEPVIVILIAFVLKVAGSLLNKMAEEGEEELKNLVLGMIRARRSISIKELAAKFSMTPEDMEKFLAQLAQSGEFRGTIHEGVVYAEPSQTVPQAPVPVDVPSPPPAPVAPSADVPRPSPSDEGTVVVDNPSGPVAEQQASTGSVGSVQEAVYKAIIDGDEARLEQLAKEGVLDENDYKEAVSLIRAYKMGVISEESLKSAARELAKKAG